MLVDIILAMMRASYRVSRDSPRAPWRFEHSFTEACRMRRCGGESCVRREAIIAFAMWFDANVYDAHWMDF